MTVKPLPPPNVHPDEETLICVEFNEIWRGYIIALLRPALFPEFWGGTLEENRQARRDVQNLIHQFLLAEDCSMAKDCCQDVQIIQRVNSETGRLEVSDNGGETWKPSPNDPITNIVEQPPPVTGGVSGNKCDAASNGLEHVKDWVARVSTNFDIAVTFLEFAAAVIIAIADLVLIYLTGGGFTAFQTEIFALLGGLMTVIWNAGKEAWDLYWTVDEYDRVLCALVCTIGNDGAFTDGQYTALIARIRSTMTGGPAKLLFIGFLQSIGRAGVNNLCSYGNAADSDCSSCACDCDFSAWEAQAGELISRNASHIVVHATFGGGQWNARIKSPDINSCCCNIDFTVVGSEPGTIGFIPCSAENDNDDFMEFAYTGQSANLMAFAGESEYTITIFSTGECE